MRSGGLWALLFLSSVSGCVSDAPMVMTDAPPDPDVGYVAAAMLNLGTRGAGYGLGVIGPDGRKVDLTFDGPMVPEAAAETRLLMVALPPGTYVLDSLVIFGPLRNVNGRTALRGGTRRSFLVTRGQVVFLGRFSARTSGFFSTTCTLRSEPTSSGEALAMVRRGYPRMSELPVGCLLCSDPVAGARHEPSAPAPGAAAASAEAPAGPAEAPAAPASAP